MTLYVVTLAAEADLRAIIRHTRNQWGEAQVRRYIATLEQGIIRLATGPDDFKDMSTLLPGLRMARCGHHYVFCVPQPDKPALILAILHERMDVMIRLSERLDYPTAPI